MKVFATVLVLATALGACAGPGLAPDEAALDARAFEEGSADFADSLYQKHHAEFGDGLRVAYLLATGQDEPVSVRDLRKELIDREILPPSWNYREDDTLTRGDLGFLLARTLDLGGGLLMRIFGTTRRAATRACIQKSILKPGSPYDRLSGRDVLGALQRAEEYQTLGRVPTIGR